MQGSQPGNQKSSTSPRLLQRAHLVIPFTARRSKVRIGRGQQCQVAEYIIYDSLVACDLCNTDAKAGRQVVITVEGCSLHSGLNCFEDMSGITASYPDQAIRGHLGVAVRLRNLSTQSFSNEAAMLAHIKQLVTALPPGGELDQIERELRRLKAADHFNASDLRCLEEVIDLLALQQFAVADPDAYERVLEATFGHPGRKAEEARSKLKRNDLQPARLTRGSAANLQKAMRMLRELPDTVRYNPSVLPWNFPDRDTYIAALKTHYRGEADAGNTVHAGKLQLQFDRIHLDRRQLRLEDIVTNLGIPCVLPIYDHPAVAELNFTSPAAMRLIERGNHLPHGTMEGQFYLSPEVHQATVRTDPEHRRTNNHGMSRSPNPEDTTTITFRVLALWRPDAWQPIYRLWHQHGRDRLLTFPGQNQPGAG